MVNVTRGVLVTCSDPAIKQFILHIDMDIHFGIQDLDETHLLMYNLDESKIELIQKKLDDMIDENTYQFNPEERDKLFRINVV